MAQITRTNDADIEDGNTIDAAPLDAEFDNLVNAHNTNDTLLTAVATGDYTFTGVKIFGSTPKTDAIAEKTPASGVTIDSVLLKDGGATLSGLLSFSGSGSAPALTFHPGYKTGRYYGPPMGWLSAAGSAGQGISSTNTVAVPFYISRPQTFDRIAIKVDTAVGASTLHLAIYNNGADGLPSTRLLDAGTVSGASVANVEAVISQALGIGWYWVSVRSSSAGVGLAYQNSNFGTIGNMGSYLIGDSSFPGNLGLALSDSADTPGTFTATPTLISSPNAPMINLRAA